MTEPPPPSPGYPPPPPAEQAPNNYLVLSIVGLVLCVIPGIVAVVKSAQVSGLWAQGQYAESQAVANSAKTWAIWSIILGGVAYVAAGILATVLIFAGDHSAAMPAMMF